MARGRDMTQGTIWKQIVPFAVPLFFGHLLQQTHNVFDSIIVGNYVSSDALAAVGSSGPLINMIVSFFMGLSGGASVLISRAFGAKDTDELRKTVHTALLLSLCVGVGLSVIGVVFSPALLRLMQVPEQVLGTAVIYLRIYFGGLVGLTVYNMGAAVLTATGDSKRPLYFLASTAIFHVGLNFVFVLVFDLGVAGVAFSTIISQAIRAVLVITSLYRSKEDIRFEPRLLRFDKPILKNVIRFGLPGGIQGSMISGSNMIMQAYINMLGVSAAAAFGATQRIDALATIPISSLAMATSTFVAQNLGGAQVSRARQGAKVSIRIAVICTLVISALVLTFDDSLVRIFSSDPEVLAYGLQFIWVLTPCYVFMCFTQIQSGALRGAGDIKIPTIIYISYYVVLRQIYLFIATKIHFTAAVVAFAWPSIWFISAVTISIYYRKSNWSAFERKIEEETQ